MHGFVKGKMHPPVGRDDPAGRRSDDPARRRSGGPPPPRAKSGPRPMAGGCWFAMVC